VTPRTVIRFAVTGTPSPQGSKTTGRTKTGHSFVREDNPQLTPWRNALAYAAHQAMNGRPPLTGPAYLEAAFRFPRPKSHYRTGKHAGELKPAAPSNCPTRPDLDKLTRALGDAITGIALTDDAQIAELLATKTYGPPGVDVYLCNLNE